MDEKHPGNDHYDEPWKEFLNLYFPQFLKFFFPRIYEEIDWKEGFEFLEQELREIIPEMENGKRFVDKLVKVYRKNGKEAWVYIHIEIQSQRDKNLPERVYDYNCRLYVRYRCPIISLVVLGDENPNWRPEGYGYELWGSQASLTFQTVKLLDYRGRIEELMKSRNPFAYFVIAHLRTLETRGKPEQRLEYKKALTLEMLELGLSKKKVQSLLRFIDYLMRLPKSLEDMYLSKIKEYQEKNKMPIIAPFEQIAMEEGMKKGIEKGIEKGIKKGRVEGIRVGELRGSIQEAQGILLEMLYERFGEVPVTLKKRIQRLEDTSILRGLCKQILRVDSLKEFTQLMK